MRKAMGARTADVLRLLMIQFARPIVIANLTPGRWRGSPRTAGFTSFAYRIDQTPWLYLAVGVGVVTIALGNLEKAAWSFG